MIGRGLACGLLVLAACGADRTSGDAASGDSGPTSSGPPESDGDGTTESSGGISSGGSTQTDSTASGQCGDGDVGPSEVCDDGNREDGDGCNQDCVPSGVVLWERVVDGGIMGHDQAHSLAVTSQGYAVVGATVTVGTPDSPHRDIWVRAYDSEGAELWTHEYDGPDGGDDGIRAVTTGPSDEIVIAGSHVEISWEPWLRKLTPAGATAWTLSGGDFGQGGDLMFPPEDVTVDDAGNVAFTTVREVDPAMPLKIAVHKLDSDGVELWTHFVDVVPIGPLVSSGSIEFDASGDLFVMNTISDQFDDDTTWDGWVGKLSGAGDLLWMETLDGPSGDRDWYRGVATDPDGNAVVSGGETGTLDDLNATVHRITSAGEHAWGATYDRVPGEGSQAFCVATDSMGHVIVGGRTGDPAASDIWIAKYDVDGALMWTTRLPNGVARGLDTDDDGNVFVAGWIEDTDDFDVWVAKLAP